MAAGVVAASGRAWQGVAEGEGIGGVVVGDLGD